MAADERKAVLDLYLKRIPEEEFLRRVGIQRADASQFALTVLEQVYREKSAKDVEAGLGLAFRFGFSADYLDILSRLSEADWHRRHEDVATALGELHDIRTVETLYRAALKSHPYLEYDDSRALAGKAIRALGELADPIADAKLRLLVESSDSIVKEDAIKQLYRRSGRPSPEQRDQAKVLAERIEKEKDQMLRTQLLKEMRELIDQQKVEEERWTADKGWKAPMS